MDVASVYVRIGHDHNLVIPQLGHVEGFVVFRSPKAHTQRGDDILDLFVLVDLVFLGFLHVENLPPEWEDRLEMTVPALLRGSTRRISFHQVQF